MGESHKVVSAILPILQQRGFIVPVFVTTCDGTLLVWMHRPRIEVFIQTAVSVAAVPVAQINKKLALTTFWLTTLCAANSDTSDSQKVVSVNL